MEDESYKILIRNILYNDVANMYRDNTYINLFDIATSNNNLNINNESLKNNIQNPPDPNIINSYKRRNNI